MKDGKQELGTVLIIPLLGNTSLKGDRV